MAQRVYIRDAHPSTRQSGYWGWEMPYNANQISRLPLSVFYVIYLWRMFANKRFFCFLKWTLPVVIFWWRTWLDIYASTYTPYQRPKPLRRRAGENPKTATPAPGVRLDTGAHQKNDDHHKDRDDSASAYPDDEDASLPTDAIPNPEVFLRQGTREHQQLVERVPRFHIWADKQMLGKVYLSLEETAHS